jgi:hypothetical protein
MAVSILFLLPNTPIEKGKTSDLAKYQHVSFSAIELSQYFSIFSP